MMEKDNVDEKLRECEKHYIKCIDIRNFEITNLVGRNNFFMIFQGVIIAGMLQSSGTSPPIVQFLGSLAGLFISIFQTMTACGAKYWQEAWEGQLNDVENKLHILFEESDRKFEKMFDEIKSDKVVKNRLNHKQECDPFFINKLILARFSVSKSPIYSGIAFCIFWIICLLMTLNISIENGVFISIDGFRRVN